MDGIVVDFLQDGGVGVAGQHHLAANRGEPGDLVSGVSPTPQTAEISMSPSMLTSILVSATPR